MKSPSNNFAGSMRTDGSLDGESPSANVRRLAQAVYGDLVAMGMPQMNLLLSGGDGVIRNILDTILMDLQTPIASWYPGERLVLPPIAKTGTMILHDVGVMNQADQIRLLEWSEQAVGKTQIVSTVSTPLIRLVRAGLFNEGLYYRLNTVFVDADVYDSPELGHARFAGNALKPYTTALPRF